MANYRYSDSFPYSAKHVTYSGVPDMAAPSLVMRVTVVYAQASIFLRCRVYSAKWRIGRTPSGKVRLRKYKVHTLVPITGNILIQGTLILKTEGVFAINGLTYIKIEGLISSKGIRVDSISGTLPGAGAQFKKISGTVNATGSTSLKKQGALTCRGIVAGPALNGSVVLTGTKDLSAVLVALDMGGGFMDMGGGGL